MPSITITYGSDRTVACRTNSSACHIHLASARAFPLGPSPSYCPSPSLDLRNPSLDPSSPIPFPSHSGSSCRNSLFDDGQFETAAPLVHAHSGDSLRVPGTGPSPSIRCAYSGVIPLRPPPKDQVSIPLVKEKANDGVETHGMACSCMALF